MNTLVLTAWYVAPASADKNFIDSSPNQVRFTLKKTGQIDSYSRNLTTINFSDVSMYLLLTFDGNQVTWKFRIIRDSSIRRAKKFCNMRHYKHNSRVSQQGRKICILRFNTSQEHVNEDLTLSLA